ncbi:Peptidase, S54 (Rhomboid) family, putative [Alloalcanivorax dieselolei B5]|uniref:Peptidase, S54 (Rhomboid) family, putative n=1 Tax=Alcanivorax dieselolei (strain DSM 16502 / CGMCC 1.3690 / MCCC 1A00001 / B-5) TaxID=930169 RepID=K0CIN3_ALCDB|nr:rhomboid family intramembrane serine protease [Alloalcanivorax dieselolei]AFT71587.1 Peptidase, S54 (Rhomboid) family, putative [Alloalcanivorax dieselolei B5]GGJ89744.1 rhomboid family intramembrane serine protease GlpG [Alloalcanivorax dieselolei]
MIELVRVNNAALAARLVHMLGQRGIRAELRPEQDGQVVSVAADRFEEARELCQAFLASPDDRRWQEDAWHSNAPADVPRQALFSGGWFRSLGLVTKSGLVLCVLVYLSPFLLGDRLYAALMFPPSLDGLAVQPWRVVTPMLLHMSLLHILFNLLWWCDLGRVIERFQSSFQLLWITLVTAAVSNLAQFYDTGPNFGGLSGVVYGLLGYLWLYGKVNPGAGYQLRKEVVVLMLVWLVICYVGLSGIVANSAHLAGLLSGMAIGTAVGLWRRQRPA